MPRVSMDAHGRFGQMFVSAVDKKGVSLRQVAAKFDYSYEQMRKLVQGKSWPSEKLLHPLCQFLDMNYDEALLAANGDRMEKQYGTTEANKVMGRNPRLSDIEPYLPQLNDREWNMFVAQIAGYVRERRRSE